MITDDQLSQICPQTPADKRQLYLPHLNDAMQAQAINTLLRVAAFIAQLAHESGEFRWMEEIWGPTAAQKRYEPPGALATQLGNTQPGDGLRFKGRGPIQITGRANYQKYGDLLGLDLVGNPPSAATPDIAFSTAGVYWLSNGLNELADVPDFIAITRRINGGLNGLADRQVYYARAQAVLGVAAATPAEPLMRGFQAITSPGTKTVEKTSANQAALEKTAVNKAPRQTPPTVAVKKAVARKVDASKAVASIAPARPAAAKKSAAAAIASKKAARRSLPAT